MKPLIGLTAYMLREPGKSEYVAVPADYMRAVQRAGGIPVILPFCENEAEAAELIDRLDGLLLAGGSDVDPNLYGEEPHPKLGAVSPERDLAELSLARVALGRNMPVLGICRGHQVLAVAAGGTLYQDIPAQVAAPIKHSQEAPRWFASHTVTVQPGTRLAALLGTELKVNSFHHQAVKGLPEGWVASAEAADGVNEAMEHPGLQFALGVQWHPENFTGRPYSFDRLFEAFVAACKS